MMRNLNYISILLTFSLYSQNPSVDAGPDISACEDESSILITGASISDSINNFVWSIVQGDGTITNSYSLEPIFTPSASDIANGLVELELAGSSISEQVSDRMTIYLIKNPTVFAGTDVVINQGEDYLFADAMASDYSDVFWTHTGNGLISDSSIINPIYTPSQADYNNGYVTFGLNASSITPCSNTVVDEMTLSFTPPPTVYAGEDLTVCGNEYVQIMDATVSNVESLIWTSSGDGSFTNSDSLSPLYLAGPFDIESGYVNLTLTATGSGQTVSDTMTINFSRPQVQLSSMGGSSNQVVCDGESISDIVFEIENGADSVEISWDVLPPSGIYSAYDTISGEFTLSGVPAGVNQDTVYNYTLKAINMVNGCESEQISGSITVLNSHDLELISSPLTAHITFCEGEPLPDIIRYEFGGGATSARVLGNLPTGITWSVSSNFLEISGTPTVNVSGTPTDFNYTIETIGPSCDPATETGTITIIPNPQIQISNTGGSPNQILCEGTPIDDIVFNVIDNAERVEILWNVTPTGISHQFDPTTKEFVISGTPINIDSDISYNYTLKAVNDTNGCESQIYTGNIDVNAECINSGKIELNGPVEVNNGTLFIKEEDGLILKSSKDNQCYRITIDDGDIVAVPVNCEQ